MKYQFSPVAWHGRAIWLGFKHCL